ncbi:MAG: YqjF family protein [Phycisphaerae bacterium]
MSLPADQLSAPRVFLSAEWRHLVMVNYIVDPAILRALVPQGTELELWNGDAFVSVVGFLFQKTRINGVPVPFHQSFEEVNLRFYVRRLAEDGWRRGVVFIRELVPKRMVAWVARTVYNEKYSYVPMSHEIQRTDDGAVAHVRYSWKFRGATNAIRVDIAGAPTPLIDGSEEEFIAEHYWGYATQRDGGTMEYHVTHPRWSVASASTSMLDCDVAALYGREFAEPLSRAPSLAFYADGSAVEVYGGRRLPETKR